MFGAALGGLVLCCGSAERAKVAAVPAPSAQVPAAPRELVKPKAPDATNNLAKVSQPEPAPASAPVPEVERRPPGVADCVEPEKAELLVIIGAEPNTPELREVAYGPDAPTTVYLGSSGCAVKRVPGVSVRAKGKIWQLQTKNVKVRTSVCSIGDEVREPGEGSAERVELTTPGARQVVATPPARVGENEFTETTRFVAAIGEALYFRQTSYSSNCGAHGGTGSRFFAHDLARRKLAYFADSLSDEQALLRVANESLDPDSPMYGPFRFAGTLPYYADGFLRFVAQLTTSATYAESDELAGSYARSVFMPTQWFGADLDQYREPPPALAAAVAERNLRVFGWSRL